LNFKKEQLSQSKLQVDSGTCTCNLKTKKMKVKVMSIPVLDQEKALQFYTGKLGFIKKFEVPLSEDSRWLTVVAKEEQDGTEILLEPSPNHFEPAKIYQKALFDAGIPYTQFNVDNVQKEYERLINLDVEFSVKPTEMGTVKIAVLNDTCGNNIQIVELL
jgi:catechol 2,3-dioxygenase-like lactoylglutathione lyase family enzyme